MRGSPVTVGLLFGKATSAWAMDRTWHPSQKAILQKDGRLRLTLKAAATPELVGWILSSGDGVQVIRAPELKATIWAAAERILRQT